MNGPCEGPCGPHELYDTRDSFQYSDNRLVSLILSLGKIFMEPSRVGEGGTKAKRRGGEKKEWRRELQQGEQSYRQNLTQCFRLMVGGGNTGRE